MKLMDRIRKANDKINTITDGDSPTLVFIESVPDGYQIIEDYIKYDSKGQIVRDGGRRKQYTTTEPLNAIKSRYSPHTAILEGQVID